MITLDKCNKILNGGERRYSEEEIKMIRDFLYLVAEIENNYLNEENDECNYLL